jgi:ubiquinone/menaquinone biosynthesis C-methylase UbiE
LNRYLEAAEKYAREYDKGAVEQGYCAPEILFGFMFEYLKKGDKLLDIAIGTGLDAVLFKKAGADVYGVDGAAEMLRICNEKGIVSKLVQVDILKAGLPFGSNCFDVALAISLFHMTKDPTSVFLETSRVLKNEGVYGFTFDEDMNWKTGDYRETDIHGIVTKVHPESGLNMYRHSGIFIRSICHKAGFEILKSTVSLVFKGKETSEDHYHTVYITRKTDQVSKGLD